MYFLLYKYLLSVKNNKFKKMISNEYLESDKNEKENLAKLNLIKKSTLSFVVDYFQNIINNVDIYTETNLSQKDPTQIQDISRINQHRKTILDKITQLEFLSKQNIKYLKGDNNLKLNESYTTIQEIQSLKKLIFQNKWIFFRGNKRIKNEQVDFGRLIIIEGMFTDDLMHNFK